MEELLAIAIKASLQAGAEILSIYTTTFTVLTKEDHSPLTQADKNANTVINALLAPTNIPIISEENTQTNFTTRKTWERCWMVDPLDGTKEFVKKNGAFTVNIALIEKGVPVMGVIYVPVTKTIYYTYKGNAYRYSLLKNKQILSAKILNNAQQIQPSQPHDGVYKVVVSRSHLNEKTSQYIKHMQEAGKAVEIIPVGSSVKFCYLAEGTAHLYPRFAPTMEWDTAAGQAICNAVGIQVLNPATNTPLSYNKENLYNPNFIASISF